MPSPIDPPPEPRPAAASPASAAAVRRSTSLRTRIALYAAAATVLFVVERALPNPVPWVRLGLANVVTLVALLEHGAAPAAAVVALRLLLGGFFTGGLFGPQFALAVCGATASWFVMTAGARLGARYWSPLGLSLLGASAHAVAQIAAAGWLVAGGASLWALLPLFLGLSIATGLVTGLAADALLRRLDVARALPGP
jgi:heptaprenyl diphosphate synthase